MSQTKQDEPLEILRAELLARTRRNPQFSLRAFARVLGLAPARLSELLSQKRKMTSGQAHRIADGLGYPPAKRRRLLETVEGARAKTVAPAEARQYTALADDHFAIIADWWHFAILSLLETVDARDDAVWIGRRLRISPVIARGALARLERLGLLTGPSGARRPTHADLTTSHDLPSSALRISHTQSLKNAVRALAEVPVQARDISSITMAIDPARLPEAKALICDFRRRLAALLEAGTKSEVYDLNVQLVPLSLRTKS